VVAVGRAGNVGVSPMSNKLGGSYREYQSAITIQLHGIKDKYLSKLWYVDKAGQELQVRAFIVEFAQIVVLRVEARPKGFQSFVVIRSFVVHTV
jgi:hypothetical protein